MKYRYILILITFISCKTEINKKQSQSNKNIQNQTIFINGISK
ncbi:hypothetical protein SAMN05216503_1458 [Polaribacter sp. KT25b]|nr:hypothetical protein SAMN05216503_1458 [Polaribacter sp. KT25b]